MTLFDASLVALVLVCPALSVGTPDCGWPNGSAIIHVYRAGTIPTVTTHIGPHGESLESNNGADCHSLGANFHPHLDVGEIAIVQCVDSSDPGLVNVK